MFTTKFGIEVECTGVTRACAAQVVAEVLGGSARYAGGGYGAYHVSAPDAGSPGGGRVWKIVSDASIVAQKKEGKRIVSADSDYKVELVSPILTYQEDIDALQEIIRGLRKAGAFPGKTCGIHIHLNGADHTPRSIRNFVNIIASKNELFYKALQIEPERMRYCKKMDARLVERMNQVKPKTAQQIADIWYEGYYGDRSQHYHESRYSFLNLHSYFSGNHTVELRGFNAGTPDGKLHAGLVRSYIVLALALNNQALTQKSASARKPQTENEKFAMRVYLNRIGFIGDEFKNCREHLCQHLSGNSAWRYRSA